MSFCQGRSTSYEGICDVVFLIEYFPKMNVRELMQAMRIMGNGRPFETLTDAYLFGLVELAECPYDRFHSWHPSMSESALFLHRDGIIEWLREIAKTQKLRVKVHRQKHGGS